MSGLNKLDARQSVLRIATSMLGSAVNDPISTIFPKIDSEMAKLYEDRNILLADGGVIDFTGSQLQFTENLNLILNSKIVGGTPIVISLGSANIDLSASGKLAYAIINRTAGTATVVDDADTMPTVVAANQEVFLIVKRIDTGTGLRRAYFRNGVVYNDGQSSRLGEVSSGAENTTGITTQNLSQMSKTILTGNSYWHPFLIIDSIHNYVFQTGTVGIVYSPLTVNGTLDLQGTAYIKVMDL